MQFNPDDNNNMDSYLCAFAEDVEKIHKIGGGCWRRTNTLSDMKLSQHYVVIPYINRKGGRTMLSKPHVYTQEDFENKYPFLRYFPKWLEHVPGKYGKILFAVGKTHSSEEHNDKYDIVLTPVGEPQYEQLNMDRLTLSEFTKSFGPLKRGTDIVQVMASLFSYDYISNI